MMEIPSSERLQQVAQLLPKNAASVMVHLPESAQTYLLQLVTVAIDYWEGSGVCLDPVIFEAVVTSIVITMAPIVRTLDMMVDLVKEQQRCSHCKN